MTTLDEIRNKLRKGVKIKNSTNILTENVSLKYVKRIIVLGKLKITNKRPNILIGMFEHDEYKLYLIHLQEYCRITEEYFLCTKQEYPLYTNEGKLKFKLFEYINTLKFKNSHNIKAIAIKSDTKITRYLELFRFVYKKYGKTLDTSILNHI